MEPLLLKISVVSSIFGVFIGLSLFLRPGSAIERQRRLYEKINWKMEPVSMEKEVSHTKMMGLFLIVIVLLTSVYIFVKV